MFLSLLLSYLLSALAAFILGTLILATFGWSLGVRRLYVRVLLKIFKVKYKYLYVFRNCFNSLDLVCQTCLQQASEEEQTVQYWTV